MTVRSPAGEAGFNALFRHYKRNAKKKGIEFTIDKQNFRKLCEMNCYYCDDKPSNVMYNYSMKTSEATRQHSKYVYNGLDRIDSTVGYRLDNLATCCWNCNRAKSTLEQSEFLAHVKKIYEKSCRG